jgi:hypothetical protein
MTIENESLKCRSGTAMSFDVDFLGRLKKIRAPISLSLHAVFEAVANAFDATDGLGNGGWITVRILRKPDPSLLSSVEGPQYILTGFEVEDNGVGFTDDNMTFFKRADTTNKVAGKGVGRLLWLKVFDRAEITSTYEQDGLLRRRDFTFSVERNGVHDSDAVPRPAGETEPRLTRVRLMVPKENRVSVLALTAERLAVRLLEHFLLHFTVIRRQSLTVVDEVTKERIAVGDLYADVIGPRHKEEPFEIRGFPFVLHHLFVKPATTRSNVVRLCANNRPVTTEYVSHLVPEVGRATAVTVQEKFRYHAYVTGPYLDEVADDERTGLKFPRDADEQEDAQQGADLPLDLFADQAAQDGGVSRKELLDAVANRIRVHLADTIAEVRAKKEQQLADFAAKEQPQFRPFVEQAKHHVDRLPAKPSKRQVELALYEAKIDGRDELQKLVDEIVDSHPSIKQVAHHRQMLMDKFVTEANRHNQSALVEYVCTRKAVIQVLRANMGRDQEGDYEYEAPVHDLFFPRSYTSDALPVGPTDGRGQEIENLWLIDEKLVFHRLLGSDLPLTKLRGFLAGEPDDADTEPDIVIFDPVFVTIEGGGIQSLAVIEFKRPGRDDYNETLNPVQQIINATKKIRAGFLEGRDGEIQTIREDMLAFGYAICDVRSRLKGILENTYDMKQTPDKLGYYKYHEKLNLLIEVIPYSKLIQDAERRNAAFFKKLGLP